MKPDARNTPLTIPYDEIIMLHDQPYDESTEDELYNITIAEELGDVISTTGIKTTMMPFNDDTISILAKKKQAGENFAIFNLVENVDRKPEWQPRAMEALEKLGVPFTGTDTGTLLACDADKFRMKELLQSQNLPTPPYATRNYTKPLYENPGKWLVKSAIYHGSFNVKQENVSEDPAYLLQLMQRYEDEFGGLWFADRYLPGREFFIGMIGMRGEDPELLPETELTFDADYYSNGKLPFLTEDAKWEEPDDAHKTVGARYGELAPDSELRLKMEALATRSWHALGLGGYARIDFRLDEAEQPCILEVNTNPYLAIIDDSYIYQPAARAGLTVADVLTKIILCANPAR
jgi:D-alanine-D-alanine ligase